MAEHDEKMHWLEVANELADIMRIRLGELATPDIPPNTDMLKLIHLFKEEGVCVESDKWLVDMAICVRSILKNDCCIDVELYTDDEEYPPGTLDFIDFDQDCILTALDDLKNMLMKEYMEEGFMAEEIDKATNFFNSKGYKIDSHTGLISHIGVLNGEEMREFLQLIYLTDDYLSQMVDNTLLCNT